MTNTKSFSWESESNFETLQKPSSYFWVSYKKVCGGSKFIVIIVLSNVLNVEYSAVTYSTGDNVTIQQLDQVCVSDTAYAKSYKQAAYFVWVSMTLLNWLGPICYKNL